MVWEVLRLNVSFVCFFGAGRMFQWGGLGFITLTRCMVKTFKLQALL